MLSDEFEDGTLIQMADGSKQRVENICCGEQVMTQDGKSVQVTDTWRDNKINVLEYDSDVPLCEGDLKVVLNELAEQKVIKQAQEAVQKRCMSYDQAVQILKILNM